MRTTITGLTLLLCLLLLPVGTANAVTVGPNIDITLGNDLNDRQQAEPTVAVHPLKPNILVAGAQDYRLLPLGGHRWHGYYRSIDGGATWSVSLVPGFPGDNSPEGLASPLRQFRALTDPVMAFDLSGNLYYTGISTSFTLFVVKYVNDGADYAFATVLPRSTYGFADKPWIAVDTSGGPNDGNAYIVYDGFASDGTSGVFFIRSTDGGLSFSTPIILPAFADDLRGFFAGITVGPNGHTFVSYLDNTHHVLVSKSTDGGLTFQPAVSAAVVVPLPPTLPGNEFRTFTIPQIASDPNGVYVVWDDFRTGKPNVQFTRSTDGGTTWSFPLTVNNPTAGHQFYPTIAVSGGIISVGWYDSRLGTEPDGTITGLDVFYSRSIDGGETFSENIRITTVSFDPNLVARADFGDTQPFIGDYTHMAGSATSVHIIWTDNRNACNNVDPLFGCTDQDAFVATITF